MATEDLMRGLSELDEEFEGYVKADRYYEGDPDEFFASARLARLLAAAGERFRINLAKTPVDVVANRLRLASVSVPGDDAATALIEEIHNANDLDLHGPNFSRRATEYGDCYAIVWPFVDDAEESDEDEDGADPSDDQLDGEAVDAQVEISYVDPMHGRMIYDTERPNRKAYFVMRWTDGERRRANVYYADRIERYVTKVGTKGKAAEEWEEYEDGPVDNPYGEIPVFHFRTDAPYGRPEHYDAYGLQDAVNKLFVTQMGTTELHGFPQRVALLDPQAILDQANDGPDWDDDADATEDDSRPTSSNLRGGPGTMIELAGVRDVKEFTSADPQVFIQPFELYVRVIAQVTTTPLHYFDPSGDQPSGESRRTADLPLDQKVGDRKRWFGATWAELWRFALKIRGREVETVDVRWEPNQVMGDESAWTVIQQKQALGVPQRQTLLEAGYSPEQVDEWLSQRADDMDLQRRVEILDKIGDAVQKLGSGVALGLFDAAAANEIISRIVGQTAPAPDPEEIAEDA